MRLKSKLASLVPVKRFGAYSPILIATAALFAFAACMFGINWWALKPYTPTLAELRALQLLACAAAAALWLLAVFYTFKARRADLTAKQHQVFMQSRIVAGLSEGVFVQSFGNKLAAPVPAGIKTLFRRNDLEGLSLESLLRNLVPGTTLTRVIEHLRAAQNQQSTDTGVAASHTPIEVELHFDRGGGFDSVHVELEFRPVTGSGDETFISIRDVTARATLTTELSKSHREVETQLELLLGVLHLEPARLSQFLVNANKAVEAINAVLKKPAREEQVFRAKLEEILQEVRRVKSASDELAMATVAAKAQVFEDSLHELRRRESLGGNDFLPLAVKLDDLFGTLANVNSAATRIANFRSPTAAAEAPADIAAKPRMTENGTLIIAPPTFTESSASSAASHAAVPLRAAVAGSLEGALQSFTQHAAQELGKQVNLRCKGLEQVPAQYQAAVKNVVIQFVRNSLAHGIESPADRIAAAKPEAGKLDVEFRQPSKGGYELRFEDDGCGLDPDEIRRVAVSKGIVSAQHAAGLNDRQAIKLIFKSGFSTSEEITRDKGRGVGMSVVRRYVSEAGGRIGLASVAGVHTRFRVGFPPLAEQQSAVA
jgi:two-component system, chemotaxis family, sensor kinase CheA